jgi:hypothetical protein
MSYYLNSDRKSLRGPRFLKGKNAALDVDPTLLFEFVWLLFRLFTKILHTKIQPDALWITSFGSLLEIPSICETVRC